MKGSAWKYKTGFLIFFSAVIGFLPAQNDPKLDSLQNLVNTSTGDEKVLNLIRLSDYYWILKLDRERYNIAYEALKLAETTPHKRYYYDAFRNYLRSFGAIHNTSEAEDNLLKYHDFFLKRNDKKGEFWVYYFFTIHFTFSRPDYHRASEYANKALVIARTLNDPTMLESIYDSLSKLYHVQGQVENEKICYEKNLDLYIAQKWNAAGVLLDLARFYVNKGDYAKSIEYFRKTDSAIAIREDMVGMEHTDKCFLLAKQTGNIARAYRLWGHYDSALIYHRLAIKKMVHCQKSNPVDIANQLEGIGIIYTQWGIFDSAKVNFQKSIQIREECNDWLGVGYSLDGLGYVCHLIGDYEGAVNLYIKALNEKLKEKPYPAVLNRVFSLKEGQSISHLRLGLVYTDWNYPEAALDEFNQSLNLCREIGFASGETEALIGIGKLFIKQKKNKDAEEYLEKALQKSRESDDLSMQAVALKNFGILQIEKGDFVKAIQFLNEAVEFCRTTENVAEIAEVDFYLGKTEFLQGNYNEACKKLSSALRMAESVQLSKLVLDCHELLARVYEKSGNLRLAFDHDKTGSTLRDSLYSRQTSFFLANMNESIEEKKLQLQLDLEQKESEVKKTELSEQQNRLIGLLGLGLLTLTIIILLSRYYRLRVQNHHLMLQQRLFRTRMNPSFIHTSINDLDNMLGFPQSAGAIEYISFFARYMQQVLQNMRDETLTLNKEIEMIRNYLEMRKLAYAGKFDFNLIIDPDFESGSRKIQPLPVRTTIDSIIRKILQSGIDNGVLKLTLTEKKNSVLFVFEDNATDRAQLPDDLNQTEVAVWNQTVLELQFSPSVKSKPIVKLFPIASIVALMIVLFPIFSTANQTSTTVADTSYMKQYLAFSDKYMKLKNYDSAYFFLKLYLHEKKIKDSLDHDQDLKMLMEKYRIETKQLQLQLFNRENNLHDSRIKMTRYSVFGVSGLLILAFLFWLLDQNRRRLSTKREIGKAEQYLLLSQMNPHFIYNALTNIQSLIIKQDIPASHEYLGHFRDLTTKILEHSASESIILREEIQIITSYLNLQKLRYGDKFDSVISLDDDPGLPEQKIPPMMLQPLIENAIEHGIRHKEGKGHITVTIRQTRPGCIAVRIEDNGIGRKKSKEISAANQGRHHGLATEITLERVARINSEKKMNIYFEITDLYDNTGDASGTLVVLTFNYLTKT